MVISIVGAAVVWLVSGIELVGEGLGVVSWAAVVPSGVEEGSGASVGREDVGGAAVVSGEVGEGCGDGVAAGELVLPCPADVVVAISGVTPGDVGLKDGI